MEEKCLRETVNRGDDGSEAPGTAEERNEKEKKRKASRGGETIHEFRDIEERWRVAYMEADEGSQTRPEQDVHRVQHVVAAVEKKSLAAKNLEATK